MDQLIYASLFHTHYWYEVGMLKVESTGDSIIIDQRGKVANPARGELNRENEYFLVPVRA